MDLHPDQDFREMLAKGVRGHRVADGITPQQLAARTEELGYLIPEEAITEIELGRWAPRPKHEWVEHLTLCVAFDVSLAGLMISLNALTAESEEDWRSPFQGPQPPPRSEPGDTPATWARRFIRTHPESGSIDDDSTTHCTCGGWSSG